MHRSLVAAFAGLVVGSLATVTYALAGDPPDEPVVDTSVATTTTQAPTPEHWFDTDEARIGPSVVIARDLRSERGQLVLTYDVVALTPTAGLGSLDGPDSGPFGTTFEPVAAVPAAWTLSTPSGDVAARVFGPGDRSTRFTTDAASATAATIDSYWAVAPLSKEMTFGLDDASWHDVAPGLRLRLVDVIEQTGSFLVIVEAAGEAPTFRGIGVEGVGRAWASSSRSMLGTIRWTLDYRGEDLPDPLTLVVRGTTWVEVEADVRLGLGGVGS